MSGLQKLNFDVLKMTINKMTIPKLCNFLLFYFTMNFILIWFKKNKMLSLIHNHLFKSRWRGRKYMQNWFLFLSKLIWRNHFVSQRPQRRTWLARVTRLIYVRVPLWEYTGSFKCPTARSYKCPCASSYKWPACICPAKILDLRWLLF